jgi:Ala-tRNA(Pro) deacylase
MNLEQKSKVYEELKRLGIQYTVIEHPAAYTIEEIDSIVDISEARWIAKNLFLRDANGKRHFLVVIDKDKKADLKEIRRQLSASNLSFASEDRLMKYMGLTKGSVTPLGILNDKDHAVEVVFDRDLINREQIGVHPNDNTATVMLSFSDIEKIIRVHGNTMHIIDL